MTINSFFNRIEFRTNEYWQHTGQNLMVDISHIDNNRLRYELLEFIDLADFVRCFLGLRAEFTEHMDNPGLDEFSDILFYLARVHNYVDGIVPGGLQPIMPQAKPLDDCGQFLDRMDQPIRNMLRPSDLKVKHRTILINNLQRFAGACLAHMAFQNYTEEDVIRQLDYKLAPRYNK